MVVLIRFAGPIITGTRCVHWDVASRVPWYKAILTRKMCQTLAALLFATGMLQSCIGAGDMFAEKRTVVGDYFLMADENDQHSYFLFRRGSQRKHYRTTSRDRLGSTLHSR